MIEGCQNRECAQSSPNSELEKAVVEAAIFWRQNGTSTTIASDELIDKIDDLIAARKPKTRTECLWVWTAPDSNSSEAMRVSEGEEPFSYTYGSWRKVDSREVSDHE